MKINLLLIIASVFLCLTYSERIAAEQDSQYLINYLLPANPGLVFEDVKDYRRWQESADGWLRQDLTQWDYWVGDTPKIAWVKLEFKRPQTKAQWVELASSGVSRAQLFYWEQNLWKSVHSETLGAQREGNIHARFLAFDIAPEWTRQALFIRVEATTKLHIQLNLKSNSDFINQHQQVNGFFFVCYGILLVMFLYNLVLGRFLEDRLYFVYASAIALTLAYQFFAHGHPRLFIHLNWDVVNHILNVFAMLSAFSAMLFLYLFANFSQHTPRLSQFYFNFLKVFMVACILVVILPTNASLNVTLLIAGPTPLITLFFALWCWRAGSKSAGIFVLAWIFYILGGFLWVLYWLGLVTLNHWVELPLVAGAAIESILLSLALGYRIQLMKRQSSELQQSELYYKTISEIDPLTKLANRRAFDQHLEQLQEHDLAYSLVLLDIDNFKLFNDTYGHLGGDKVIEKMGEILQGAIREDDLAARIGGEEFALVILNDNIQITHQIAERIRRVFSEQRFEIDQQSVHCTVSIGLSVSVPKEPIKSLINRTDKALYKAKNLGRNQVQVASI